MRPLLAQLTGDEVGVVRMAIGVFSALFVGLIGWVSVYMRRQAERVELHVTEIALLKKAVEDLEQDVRDLRRARRKPEDSSL